MSHPDQSSVKAVPEAVQQALGDRYRIEAHVANGTGGAVYRGRDLQLGREVGIKVLRPGPLTRETRDRFLREGRVTASLRHPNILDIYDVAESHGVVFQVREWIEGGSLAQILKQRHRLDLGDALTLGHAVARALEVAHERDILHRDVKPSNVLVPVGPSGRPDYEHSRLADFGVLGEILRNTGFTQTGQFFGTPYYMAPEQLTAGAQSQAADVWGLGALLYEALVGRHPFEASNLMELLRAVVEEPLEFPPHADVPPAVEEFVRRCLEKDPGHRPRQPSERLRVLLAGAAPSGAAPAADEGDAAPFPIQPAPASRAPATRHLLLPVVLALAGLAVVSLVLFATLTPGEATPTVDLLMGAGLLVTGVAMGVLVHRSLGRRGAGLEKRTGPLVATGRSREELSATMVVLVDELVAECQKVDEKFLGMSLALMVDQLRGAEAFSERKEALLTAMELMERLRDLRTPWWVRHDKLVAFAVAMTGVLSGAVKIVDAVRGF